MKRLTVDAIQTQAPRRVAESLIRARLAYDPRTFVDSLRHWIILHVNIIDEFEELLHSPAYLISAIEREGSAFGDCDDLAMLGASILASIGLAVRFKAVIRQPDNSFGHVFTEYRSPQNGGAWLAFDPTIPHAPVYDLGDFLTMEV